MSSWAASAGKAESVFDTFPWPQAATVKQIDAVAAAARELRRVRAEALQNLKGGLRALYRTLEWTRSRPLARPSEGLLLRKIPFAVSQPAQVPGANPLKDAHAVFAAAVLAPWSSIGSGDSATRADHSTGRAAYGFSAKKDLLAQLLALNQQVAAKIEKGEAVTAPAVPPGYPAPERLVTEDCIKPMKGR